MVLFRRAPAVRDRANLAGFARVLEEELAEGRPFACLITDDRELRRLNREFLGNDYATDVLSFPSGSGSGPMGDIAISAQRAAAQAHEHGHSLSEELQILMLHGVLHLLGFDHEKDRGRMRRLETEWREKLALPCGLLERSVR